MCAEMPIVLILNLKCPVCHNDLTSVNLYQHGLCGAENKKKKKKKKKKKQLAAG